MGANDRYLLCRPRGGLNDTLCRIECCWRHAERTGRHLVIDAARSSLFDRFDRFFEVVDPAIPVTVALEPSLLAHLDLLECRPSHLQGRLGVTRPDWVHDRGYVDPETDLPTRFEDEYPAPLLADPDAALLVYEDSGGGEESFALLERVRFSTELRAVLIDALAALEEPYWAAHVRNTDSRTDYPRFFSRIRRLVGTRPLLVCSDDPDVIEYARANLRGAVLAFTGRVRSQDPKGALHKWSSHTDLDVLQRGAVEALIDLVALANAERLLSSDVRHGSPSGYTVLARHLATRKDLLDALLGVPVAERRAPDPAAAIHVDLRAGHLRALDALTSRFSGAGRGPAAASADAPSRSTRR